MSSQKQAKRRRRSKRDAAARYMVWLFSRPPWWKLWAVRKWRGEEPK